MAADLKLLLETPNARLFLQEGNEEATEVWLTFGAHLFSKPMAQEFLRRRGVPAMHVVAKDEGWYLEPDIQAILEAIRSRVDGGRRFIVLGDSMGGFAALLYSGLLLPDLIVAAAPQVIVDHRLSVSLDDRWRDQWCALAQRGLEANASETVSSSPTILVIYDPFDAADKWQIDHLRGLTNVRCWRLPFGSHDILVQLSFAGLWVGALEAAAEASDAGWRKIAAAFHRTRRERLPYYFAVGWRLAYRRRFSLARTGFKAAVDLRPNYIDGLIGLAFSEEGLGHLGDAVDALEKALHYAAGDDRYWPICQRLAWLHTAVGDGAQAEAALVRGVEMFPTCSEAHAELGQHLLLRQDDAAAQAAGVRALRRAIALGPHKADRPKWQAAADVARAQHFLTRRPQLARRVFEQALVQAPDRLETRYYLSLALERLGDHEAAAQVLDRSLLSIAADERHWWIARRLSGLLAGTGDVRSAEAMLLRLAQVFPCRAEVHAELGKFRLLRKADRAGYAGAARAFRRAVELEPREPEHRRLLADATLRRGYGVAERRPDLARRVLEQVLAGYPNHLEAFPLLSSLLERLKLPQAAIEALERGIVQAAEDGSYWWLYQRLAALHVRLDGFECAKDALIRAVRAFPSRPEVYVELARFLVWRRNTDRDLSKAARLVQCAISMRPADPAYRMLAKEIRLQRLRALYALRERRPLVAKAALEEVIKDTPDDIPSHHALSLILVQLGDHQGALETAERGAREAGDDPRYWWVYQHLAALRRQLGDLGGAADALVRGLQRFPDLPEMNIEFAGFLLWSVDTPRARSSAARRLRLVSAAKPDEPRYRLLGAEVKAARARRLVRRRPSIAKSCFQQILEQAPSCLNAYHGLSATFEQLGRREEAIDAIQRGIAQIGDDDRFWWFHKHLANMHLDSRELDQAQGVLVRAAQAFPHRPEPELELRKFMIRYRKHKPENAYALTEAERLELGMDLLFDAAWYEGSLKQPIYSDPEQHYRSSGCSASGDPHPLFSTSWYLAQAPELQDPLVTPLEHFIVSGWKQNLSPHPLFDTAYYLAQTEPGLGLDPLSHFLIFGAELGLQPHRSFDTASYLRANPEVAASRENALVSYLRGGATN